MGKKYWLWYKWKSIDEFPIWYFMEMWIHSICTQVNHCPKWGLLSWLAVENFVIQIGEHTTDYGCNWDFICNCGLTAKVTNCPACTRDAQLPPTEPCRGTLVTVTQMLSYPQLSRAGGLWWLWPKHWTEILLKLQLEQSANCPQFFSGPFSLITHRSL